MAAMHTTSVRCPACGAEVPVPVNARTQARDGRTLTVSLTPDLTDLIAHAWTHDDDLR